MDILTTLLQLKNFFNKLNNFIQWTKKKYFWHTLLGSNLGFVLYNITLCLVQYGWNETWAFPGPGTAQPASLIDALFSFCTLLLFWGILSVPFAIVINIIAKIVYFVLIELHVIKKQPCHITNKFLLYNKWYNIYYTMSFVFLLIALFIILIMYISKCLKFSFFSF